MNRIKQLRELMRITQKDLAKMLDTTQQTIGRWEKGQAEPSIKTLKDLALIFGTSVDDLLGTNPISEKPTSAYLLREYGKESLHDAFWGNFGVLIPGCEKTKWYPITESEMIRIHNCLSSERKWILLTTLNNRALAINLEKVSRIWLLDDNVDQPDDWEITGDQYYGLPFEIYRGMDDLIRDPDEWDDNSSDKYRKIVQEEMKNLGWDEDSLYEKLHSTQIHTSNGNIFSYWAEPSNLQEIFYNADSDLIESMIKINAFEGCFINFYHESTLSLIDMPLIDLIDYYKNELDDL